MTRDELARHGGPSRSTLHKAISGSRGLSQSTLARLDAALGWLPGSAARVLDGGTPVSAVPQDANVRNVLRAADAIVIDCQNMLADLRQLLGELTTGRQQGHAG